MPKEKIIALSITTSLEVDLGHSPLSVSLGNSGSKVTEN